MTFGTSKSSGIKEKLAKTHEVHAKLKHYGLEEFAKKLDWEAQNKCLKDGRPWGVDVPSDRLLKGIGYLTGGYFSQARKCLEKMDMDPEHTLLRLFLYNKFGPPNKEKISWILKHFKYERNYPEICLKAYAAIGDKKKVENLLNRGVKDSIGPEIPDGLKKAAIEFCLHHQRADTFNLLLERVPISPIRASALLNQCLLKVQNHYGLEILKKIKDSKIVFDAYKNHAKDTYTYEEKPKVCLAMEKKLKKEEISQLLEYIKALPLKDKNLAVERMEKGLKTQLNKLKVIAKSQDDYKINI
jgi:hypothetical protein